MSESVIKEEIIRIMGEANMCNIDNIYYTDSIDNAKNMENIIEKIQNKDIQKENFIKYNNENIVQSYGC